MWRLWLYDGGCADAGVCGLICFARFGSVLQAFHVALRKQATVFRTLTETEKVHARPTALIIDEKYLDVALNPECVAVAVVAVVVVHVSGACERCM